MSEDDLWVKMPPESSVLAVESPSIQLFPAETPDIVEQRPVISAIPSLKF